MFFPFRKTNRAAGINKCNPSWSQKCAHSGAGKETAFFMAPGNGPSEWRRPCPCARSQHHQILATDCLSHAKFSFPESRKGRHHQSTTQHKQLSRTCTCAQCKHVPGPGSPCLMPACPVPSAQAQPIRHDANSRAMGDHWRPSSLVQ